MGSISNYNGEIILLNIWSINIVIMWFQRWKTEKLGGKYLIKSKGILVGKLGKEFPRYTSVYETKQWSDSSYTDV